MRRKVPPLIGNLVKRGVTLSSRIKGNRPPAEKQQHKTLIKLLTKAKDTAFGKHYNFEEMLLAEEPEALFRTRVPLCDYDGMHPWWLRQEVGESDVTWPGKIKYFALSSGTAGSPSKHIPVSKDQVKAIRRASIRQLMSLNKYQLSPAIYQKQILTLSGSTQLQAVGKHYLGDVSGINVKHLPRMARAYNKPGTRISAIASWEERLDLMVKAAPKWDIGIVAGVPAWFQILMERLEERYQVESIHDLWPNLSVYLHGGVAIRPYVKTLNAHFRKPVHYLETYLASEGFVALQDRPDTDGMALLANNGIFFEFIPFDQDHFGDDGKPRDPFINTVTVADIEPGVNYALVMSTCSGAWRYLIGDVVRFISIDPPELVIDGRTKHFLSLVGEHLSVDNMTQGLCNAAAALNVGIPEFTVSGIPFKGSFAHHWFVGTDQEIDSERLTELLDEQLKILNDDYVVERRHALKAVIVDVLPMNVFNEHLSFLGKTGGQSKFPRVLNADKYKAWTDWLREKGYSIKV